MARKLAKNALDMRLPKVWGAAALVATMPGVRAADRLSTPRPLMPAEVQEQADRQHVVEPVNERLLTERVSRPRRARDVLQDQAIAPLPQALPAAELAEAKRYQAWLKKSAFQLDELVRRGELLKRTEVGVSGMAVTGRMQEMNHGFNLQYRALQNELQQEIRGFHLLANVLTAKLNTAKNAIDSVR